MQRSSLFAILWLGVVLAAQVGGALAAKIVHDAEYYILDGSYIDGTLEQAIADYGSMENYIREGLGISDKKIAKLKAQLLE